MSRAVYLATPGGARGRGGIGRMALYLAHAWEQRCPDLPLRVVDTYGPGSKAADAALVRRLACSRGRGGLLGRIAVLHVNVSERGSFLRKGLLVGLGRACCACPWSCTATVPTWSSTCPGRGRRAGA